MHGPIGAEKWIAESIKALEKAAGAKAVEQLLSVNPHAVLRGEMK